MYKKLFISTLVLVIAILSFSITFAANNEMKDAVNSVGNGIRNAVGGAVNGVEDAAKGISNASKDATANMVQTANNIGNSMMENGDNNNTNKDTNNGTNTDAYTATRTVAEDNTLMGMNSTAWTWLIIGIAGIAIVALVWYYSMQITTSNEHGKD